MASLHEAQLSRRTCNAVSLLSRTVRTLRQHDCLPRLLENALHRCRRELTATLAETDLTIAFQDGEVRCAGQTVLLYGPSDVPFGLMATAGIGEIVLAQATPADEIERLIRLLANAPGSPSSEYDIATVLRAAKFAGLQLRAQRVTPQRASDPRTDWWLLPEPMPETGFRRYIERETGTNLASRALQLLLTDLDAGQIQQPVEAMLGSLLDGMLANGNADAAAFLLEQADHRPDIAADTAFRLRRRALHAYESEWLLAQLEYGHKVQGLVTLGMQLGDESMDRLSAAANRIGIPLPEWVSSMLPPGE